MRISTRSWPACDWTSEAYFAACWAAAMWSIRSLIPVSFVKRWPISASFLSMSGAKLFQQRYEISRCCPSAGGMPVARIPARPAPVVVVRNRRRVSEDMPSPCAFRGSCLPASPRPARLHGCRWCGGTARPIPRTARSCGSSYYRNSRCPVLVALAEHLLVELADARLGHGVDDLYRVGQRPPGKLGRRNSMISKRGVTVIVLLEPPRRDLPTWHSESRQNGDRQPHRDDRRSGAASGRARRPGRRG